MTDKTIIKIKGHLDSQWKDWFEGMDIAYEGDNTIISGRIKDESFMYGILNRLRDLNLKLLSVNLVNETKNI